MTDRTPMQLRVEMSVTGGLGYTPVGLPNKDTSDDLMVQLAIMDSAKRAIERCPGLEPSGFLFSAHGRRMDMFYVPEDVRAQIIMENDDYVNVARSLRIHDKYCGKPRLKR